MRLGNTARGVFLLLAVLLLVFALVRDGDEVGRAFASLTVPGVLGSTLALGLGLFAQMLSWRALFHGSAAADIPTRDAAHVYFVGQLGKYVPGSVWAVVAQADLARRHGVSRLQSATVALAALAVLTVTGAAFSAVALAFGSRDAVATYWWALLAVPVGAAVLWPPVFNRLIGLGMRLRRGMNAPPAVTTRGLARSAAWALAMWVAFGVHAWLIAVDLGADGPGEAAVVGGAFALAWVVGFLVVLAPAGAGPREAAFVLALSPVMATGPALGLALVSRVLMIVGDGVAAGAAWLVVRPRKADRT